MKRKSQKSVKSVHQESNQDSNSSMIVLFPFRSLDEAKDGGSGPKISSVSGANRKRKWEEEEEQQKEESSDEDTSSDEEEEEQEEDDGGDNSVETNEHKDVDETKPEVKLEQNVADPDTQKETVPNKKTVQSKRLSEPAVFIPVDRSAEVQVRKIVLYIFITLCLFLCFEHVSIHCCRRLV